MNSDDMEEIMLRIYLGIITAPVDDITNPETEFEMENGQIRLKVTDGATGYTQTHKTRAKKIHKEMEDLERRARKSCLEEELENSETPAGKALIDKIT